MALPHGGERLGRACRLAAASPSSAFPAFAIGGSAEGNAPGESVPTVDPNNRRPRAADWLILCNASNDGGRPCTVAGSADKAVVVSMMIRYDSINCSIYAYALRIVISETVNREADIKRACLSKIDIQRSRR